MTEEQVNGDSFYQLFSNMPEAFALHEMICDENGKAIDYRFLKVNPAFETMTGISCDHLIGKTVLEILPQTEPYWIETYARVAQTAEAISFQHYAQSLERHYDVRAYSPGKGQFVTIFSDITEHKQVEASLQHANRALMTLSTVNHELIHATDEETLLQAICKAIVEQRGYRIAWVCRSEDNTNTGVKIVSSAGISRELIDEFELGCSVDWSPSGQALLTGETQIFRYMDGDQDSAIQRVLQRTGCQSSIALLMKDRSDCVFGVLNVFSDELEAFTEQEISLLEEMADDLSFGIDVLNLRCERNEAMRLSEQHLQQARSNLDEMISSFGKAVEARDPYTAGHQRRVAELAVAIGRLWGWIRKP